MESVSIWHVMMVVVIILEIVPTVWILQRVGLSAWWAILMFVPLANLVALWAFALARWPNVDGPANPN